MLENGLSIDLTEIEQFIRGQGLGSLFLPEPGGGG